MREYIFRGKCGNNWHYGDLYTQSTTPQIIAYNKKYDKMDTAFVDPETVGQYTGLKDKNGVKIFEGDIVVCKQAINGNFIDYHVEIGFVEMKHGAFGLHRKQGYYRPFKDWLEDYELEVIGNIHDNKEILKEGGE